MNKYEFYYNEIGPLPLDLSSTETSYSSFYVTGKLGRGE